ncbi:MAG: histidinol-phosphatase [Solirubrobacteraceae bacterium]|nr:histidinol-phosphatase [Solirubrobacteraceae bacterium]
MLTDYHVHLRPDEQGTTADKYFTPANAERYRIAAQEQGITELGASEHIYRFTAALDVWQHDLWRGAAVDDIDDYVGFLAEEGFRRGIEADFIPGREDQIANLLEARDWDYVIGSVHFLGDLAVDHLGWDIWDHTGQSPEKVWTRYFQTLGECGRSGLFDILAHPDLVKVWGGRRPKPEGDLRRYYELAIDGIVEGGAAVEVSTAGLRKPVGEIYPDPAFLEMCIEAGCDFTLSSDAHTPADLGSHYERAAEFLAEHGVTELTVFNGRERRKEPIG